MKRIISFALFAVIFSAGLFAQQAPWQNLIKNNFDNWEQKNGEAKYEIIDQCIVGSTVLGTPNSFLCTKKDYSDFILEYEFLVDPALNSGVQIRSLSLPEYNNGRVHGYQIEIDPSDRAWSAGIYDEARRGWLYNLEDNPEAQKAFKQNEWNKIRIEAIGPRIRTYINGVPATDLLDDMTLKGLIALQVHGVGHDKSKENIKVKWRNIRIITENPQDYVWPEVSNLFQMNNLDNNVSEKEQKQGWMFLWDGKTTHGWRSANNASFPKKGWEIKDGVLSVLESGGKESDFGGDIITNTKFDNFELQLHFKITKGANSGIKYFVDPAINKGTGSAIGLEFQILDDYNHPDAKNGVNGNRTVGSLYDLIPALSSKRFHGPGAWNHARILVKGKHVEHWLNGIKVVEYERGTQMFKALVDKSKYKIYPGFGESKEGYILLQDHGNQVSFKNIKIKEL